MTAIRYVEAPRRQPGESGRAFVERMLAELNRKGGATAPPPKVEITAKTVKVDKTLQPKPKPTGEIVLDFRGQPDIEAATKRLKAKEKAAEEAAKAKAAD